MATTFERRILHHGPSPTGAPQILSQDAIRSAWFELHRQGGCGSAEIQLADTFDRRERIEIGDWISFESAPGVRWYLGRVEERRAEAPARVRFRLEGMAIELNEIFPGGFGVQADGRKPHRYAGTDLFTHDPDRFLETRDDVGSAEEVVRLLMSQYVVAVSHIAYEPAGIEAPSLPAPVESLKFRGEESVRSILKELALRAQSATWGVDQSGTFFFRRPRTSLLWTYREGRDLVSVEETRDREYLFNRILLTGDYVYDRRDDSSVVARRSYRWRANFIQRESQQLHGDRRVRIWLPWIRTQRDSLAFAREFFRAYSRPSSRFFIETVPLERPPVPWDGCVRVEDRNGTPLITGRIETVRVLFDHALRVRMELGPDNPRNLWPEPPQDERWELPDHPPSNGGDVTLPPTLPSVDPPPGSTSGPPPSFSESWPTPPSSSDHSSLDSTLDSSDNESSSWSSDATSSWDGTSIGWTSGSFGSSVNSSGDLESSWLSSSDDSSRSDSAMNSSAGGSGESSGLDSGSGTNSTGESFRSSEDPSSGEDSGSTWAGSTADSRVTLSSGESSEGGSSAGESSSGPWESASSTDADPGTSSAGGGDSRDTSSGEPHSTESSGAGGWSPSDSGTSSSRQTSQFWSFADSSGTDGTFGGA